MSSQRSIQARREIDTQKRFQHENIVSLYASWETSDSIFLLLEYIDGVDLFGLVYEGASKSGLGEETGKEIARQLLNALVHLHGLGILHR